MPGDAALIGCLESRDQVEKGGLANPGRSLNGENITFRISSMMSSPGKARGQDADGEHGEGQPQDPEGKGRRLCGTIAPHGLIEKPGKGLELLASEQGDDGEIAKRQGRGQAGGITKLGKQRRQCHLPEPAPPPDAKRRAQPIM